MKYCPRCSGFIHEESHFCEECGMLQSQIPPSRSPWKRLIIIGLSLFLLLGTAQALYDRFMPRREKEVGNITEETEEPFIGIIYDKRLRDTWEYSWGFMDEYSAYNAAGNRLTIYRDRDTGELKGFTASLPSATVITLTLEDARQEAEALAKQLSFFSDPTLILEEAILVDRGPDTERYYSFHWRARDYSTGAVLLREIKIAVHPQSGEIIYLLTEDGGEVTINTIPTLTAEEARALALPEIGNLIQQPRLVEEVLYVSTAHGGQRLLWMVVFEETAREAWALKVYVDIDAHSGEILEVVN